MCEVPDIQHRGAYIVMNMIDADKELASRIIESDMLEVLMALSRLEGPEFAGTQKFAIEALAKAVEYGLIKSVKNPSLLAQKKSQTPPAKDMGLVSADEKTTPVPSDDKKTPSDDQETTSDDNKTPSDDQKTPSDDKKTPSDDKKTPSDDKKTPSDDKTTSTDDQKTPSDDKTTSSAENTIPTPSAEIMTDASTVSS